MLLYYWIFEFYVCRVVRQAFFPLPLKGVFAMWRLIGLILCLAVILTASVSEAQVYIRGPLGNTLEIGSPIHIYQGAPQPVPYIVDGQVIIQRHPQTVQYLCNGYFYRSELTGWQWQWQGPLWSSQYPGYPTQVRYLHPAHWETSEYASTWIDAHWSDRPYRY